MPRWLSSLFLALSLLGSLTAQTKPLTPQQVDTRVEKTARQMTLDEKIGQMTQIPGAPILDIQVKPRVIRKGQDGSLLWLTDPVEINRLQHLAVDKPACTSHISSDSMSSTATALSFPSRWPWPLRGIRSWSKRAQAVAAKEARADGIRWTFAPMVDIARDPRWGRIVEGAGEDPFLGAAMARSAGARFQGDDLRAPITCSRA